MGDPAGVGPEVLIKSFKKAREKYNLIAISDFEKIRFLAEKFNVTVRKINRICEAGNFKDYLNILHLEYNADFSPGQLNINNANAVIESIRIATKLCLEKKVDAMVTGPINKSILKSQETFKFSGHTDFLEHLCGLEKDTATMMMLNQHLKIIPLTIHEPLNQVSTRIKKDFIEKKISLIISDFKKYFHLFPKIAVLGLNPHAGEEGQIGNEERLTIMPAIKKFERNKFGFVSGPFPADGFFGSKNYKNYDVTIAMYHDQALIPLKLMSFSRTINVTLGLPIIRTSPGHGTGINIAKALEANCNSFYEAILFAGKMISNTQQARTRPIF